MATLSRRAVLGTGAAFLGAFDAALATAQTAPAPQRGGALVYAQLSGNRRGGDATNSRHPYFMVDLITRSAYNTLAWVDEELKLQLEPLQLHGVSSTIFLFFLPFVVVFLSIAAES